ncbi:M55 family metallopeptidase [Cohnella fermenti]|nr:M55 family metallopeptidase [Cohnella fermenti]
MRWMIRSDMEGVTGVVSMEQVVPGAAEYAFGKWMLMHDLQALLAGLLQEEDDEVVIYDIHFAGRNIDPDRLDRRVQVIAGKPHYGVANAGWLSGRFDGMILQGLHARAGTPNALLAHNYEHDIVRMELNGEPIGEIGLEAAIAGEAGVPLAMVTGDSEGAREARELMAGVITVSVKESLGPASALCYPSEWTGRYLTEGALMCRELAAQGSMAPYRIQGPVELMMQFKPGELLSRLQLRLRECFVDPETLRLTGASVLEAWEIYLKAKD